MWGCPMLFHGPCSWNHKNQWLFYSGCHGSTNRCLMCIGWTAYLSRVVHFDLGDLPVAWLCVVLQPGLSSKHATYSEHPHPRQEGEETTFPANILPGQHGQHFPCKWPLHRLIVQGVLLRLPGPRFQFPVGPDLPSHFCDEAKSLFLHHVWRGGCLRSHRQNLLRRLFCKVQFFLLLFCCFCF